MSRFAARCWIVCCFAISLATTASSAEPLEARIDALARPYVDGEVVVGMVVGVVHDGRMVIRGYGKVADGTDRVPDGDTLYEIGSVTKVMTGILLADAVTQGRMTLEDPASRFLPETVRMPSRDEQAILLRHLATHTSGLPRMPSNFSPKDPANPYADYSVEQMVEFLSGHELARLPGAKKEYSNLGVGLLGHLLARDAGVNYEELFVDRIAKPLDLRDTRISLSEDQQRRLAPPYDGDGEPAANWDIPTFAGAGALRSSASDMLKFAAASLSPPKGELGEAMELAWKEHQAPLDGEFAMGLGWTIARDGSTRWHSGQTGGYHSALFVSRPANAAVIVLTNTGNGEVDALAEQLIQMLAGADVKPREFAQPVHVADEVMQRYVGKYQLAPGFVLTVTTENGKLYVQATGQPKFRVHPRSDTEWYYKVVDARLVFDVDDAGECTELTLHQNGLALPAAKSGQ
ncbi:serine hydrolase [Aeoliella sp. SH292]|uniref:serine hydrolase n=1 Tax=Aeoliella sp. SH292 TaxID=3454464 RepID=UPI003F961908